MNQARVAASVTSVVVAVGDRFEDFLANQAVVSVDEVLGLLRSGELDSGQRLVIGQGLTADELAELRQHVDGVPEPAGQSLTHKRDAKNTMVTEPVQVAERRYEADLVLDQRSEMVEDHLTGQHIPGIVLVEAARQTWTAVTERYFPSPPEWPGTRFIIESLAADFTTLVLPLPAKLEYTLIGHETGPAGSRFHCQVAISQSAGVAATITARYRIVRRVLAAKQEAMFARQLLAEVRAAHLD
jgi:A-factor biosynthesis hotdog domain